MCKFRIIYNSYGRMGNRLWQYLDQIAWAIKYNKRVYSLFWDDSIEDFCNLRKCDYIKFPFYFELIERSFLKKYYNLFVYKIFSNKLIQSFFSSSFCKKIGFVSGEYIMFDDYHFHDVWKQEKILFLPRESITNRINLFFLNFRRKHNNSKIVGVHIRKGDYKNWNNGYFYYEDKEYFCFMEQLVSLLGENTFFFLASNEKIPCDYQKKFNILNLNNNSAVEDLFSLSQCDYIMGPQSTFSSWASFFGDKPYYFFRRNAVVDLKDFSVVKKMTMPCFEIVATQSV